MVPGRAAPTQQSAYRDAVGPYRQAQAVTDEVEDPPDDSLIG